MKKSGNHADQSEGRSEASSLNDKSFFLMDGFIDFLSQEVTCNWRSQACVVIVDSVQLRQIWMALSV